MTVVSQSSTNDNIDCNLATFALSDAPLYRALSYVWGSINETVAITLNDFEFQATTNLFVALQRLCHKPPGTYFWIDALCINQEDMDEKSHQVPFMHHIYLQAQQVMMWLGKEENDSQLAMSMIEV